MLLPASHAAVAGVPLCPSSVRYKVYSCPPLSRAVSPHSTPQTLYDLLSLGYTASPEAIKDAYKAKHKLLHPDVCGRQATDIAVLLNLAAAVLLTSTSRRQYDNSLGHNVWSSNSATQGNEALFVNEAQCIGCMQCVAVCPDTFVLEQEYGRARVVNQQGNTSDAHEEAMDLCPVECIHKVPAQQLGRLEHALTLCEREDAATLADRRSGSLGAGSPRNDPFSVAASLPSSWAAESPSPAPAPAAVTAQSQELAAAITQAWLSLPPEVREQAWP